MNVRDLIKRQEGLKLQKYLCPAQRWTVGWGHNLEARNETIPDDGITLEEAERYLTVDIQAAKTGCKALITSFDDLDPVRQAALISMCFQLGAAGLAKFVKTIRFINLGKFEEAAAEMRNSLWYTQTPNRAEELAFMVESGEWLAKG